MAVDWKGQSGMEIPVFKQQVNLKGTKDPEDFFMLHICPSPPSSPMASTTSAAGADG